tara:strand:- start:2281 stop:2853 length:573 start_codon:yes stop_codon:yes gene_type:complete
MPVNNLYTTDVVTTNPTPINSYGLLDNTSSFPPPNAYKMILTPKPGEIIQAAQFRDIKQLGQGGGIFELSLNGTPNSHTQWPSKIQLVMSGLGDVDITTSSGHKEFPGIYKIVFVDSTNPTNDVNWELVSNPNNIVHMWIYFGKNETTGIDSLNDIIIDLDIDYHTDPFTLLETTTAGPTPAPIINSFNI